MKIAIIGFSGTGKSTLARKLAKHYHLPVLHLDSVHFKENWQERTDEEMTQSVLEFLNSNSDWIIEGNYTRICSQRFREADQLIYLSYNRFVCLRNVIQRYKKYKNDTRPDMAKGCEEKLDREFLSWVFFKGHSRKQKAKYKKIALDAKNSCIFKSRKQLYKYLKKLGVENYEASM